MYNNSYNLNKFAAKKCDTKDKFFFQNKYIRESVCQFVCIAGCLLRHKFYESCISRTESQNLIKLDF